MAAVAFQLKFKNNSVTIDRIAFNFNAKACVKIIIIKNMKIVSTIEIRDSRARKLTILIMKHNN